MKLTKKQINLIISNTPSHLKGKVIGSAAVYPILGSYTKAGANWSYIAGWYEGALIVTVFGEIR